MYRPDYAVSIPCKPPVSRWAAADLVPLSRVDRDSLPESMALWRETAVRSDVRSAHLRRLLNIPACQLSAGQHSRVDRRNRTDGRYNCVTAIKGHAR